MDFLDPTINDRANAFSFLYLIQYAWETTE